MRQELHFWEEDLIDFKSLSTTCGADGSWQHLFMRSLEKIDSDITNPVPDEDAMFTRKELLSPLNPSRLKLMEASRLSAQHKGSGGHVQLPHCVTPR